MTALEALPAGPATDGLAAKPSKRMEIVVAAVALVFNTALLLLARGIPLKLEAGPGVIDARWWPSVLAIAGIVLAASRLSVVLLRPADARDDLETVGEGGARRLASSLALVVGYIGLWSLKALFAFPIFLAITPLFLAALVWLYGGRGWKSWVMYPIGMTAFIYLLFGLLLRIPL
jgi:hypothetical protein